MSDSPKSPRLTAALVSATVAYTQFKEANAELGAAQEAEPTAPQEQPLNASGPAVPLLTVAAAMAEIQARVSI